MEIELSGRNVDIPEGLRQYVLMKLKKIQKYSLKIVSLHVIFHVEKIHRICEIVVSGKRMRMTALEKSPDFYASVDAAVSNIQKQLSRFHEKIRHHRKKGIREVPA